MSSLLCAATLTIALLGAGQATSPAPAKPDRRHAFLSELQRAVSADDRRTVASLVHYPLTVLVGGFQVPLADATALLKSYDAVFTPDLQAVVAESGLARQGAPPPKYPARIVEDGMTIGAGYLWIQQFGNSYRIARVIVPTAGTIRPARRAATRVSFPNGLTSQLSGMLERRDETQTYLVKAQQGQSLRVSITGFRGTDATLKVSDAKGAPLPGVTAPAARIWTGTVSENGDYRIEVVRSAPDTEPALLFVISVTLR